MSKENIIPNNGNQLRKIPESDCNLKPSINIKKLS